MKAQTVFRKIVALGTGATMVGATIMGAMALDLGDYPAPFIGDDGMLNGKIVIGEAGSVEDMLGAVDIAAGLQRSAVTETVVGAGSVTTTNGKAEDVLIGNNVGGSANFGSSIDDTDLPFLADSTVTFDIGGDSADYDYHEAITLSQSATLPASVETGLTYSSPSEDWKDKVFMPVGTGAIGYYYVFDETMQAGLNISSASTTETISLDFLGKTLKITGATATSITAQVGTEYFMNVGDVQTVEGKEVKLVNVASSGTTAVVEVDGVRKTVTGTAATVNGLRVKVQDAFYSDALAERSATLIVGTEATKTYNDGDAYIGESEDNPVWVWDLVNLDTNSPTVGILFNLNLDTTDESDVPAYTHAPYVGDSIKLPNNFAEIKLDSLNQNEYVSYEFSEDTRDLYEATTNTTPLLTSAKVIKGSVSGLSNTGFLVGSTKADTIYLYPASNETIRIAYKDSGSSKAILTAAATNVLAANTLFRLDYGKSDINVTFTDLTGGATANQFAGNLTFKFAGVGSTSTDNIKAALRTSAANQFTYIGTDNADTEVGLLYYDGTTTTAIASWEEDTRTASGVVIKDPDSVYQKASGALKFDLPKDVTDFRANVIIQGQGSKTKASGTKSVSINPIAVGLAVLDKNAPATGNIIVVGGPCVNTKAAELMGNPANCAEGFEAGKAVIKLYAAKNAILVAGYNAQDTQGASRVLANYEDYSDKFAGKTEVTVLTTSLSNLEVS